MTKVIEQLNDLLQKYDEVRIQSFDSWRLILVACWDLTYHHHLEIEFQEVSFLQCATDFRAPIFRLAQREECAHFLSYLDGDATIFCFQTESAKYFIAARNIVIREKLVLHYEAK